MSPVLSIIIPSFNRLEETDACVRTFIARKKDGSVPVEIVIVDDGSTDSTGAYFASFLSPGLTRKNIEVRIIGTFKQDGKSRNSAFARNAGLRTSRGDIVAFCDCDIFHMVEPITPTVDAFKRNPDIYLTGTFHRVMRKTGQLAFDGPRGISSDMPHGGWLAVKREKILGIGGYDERYLQYGNEDHDIVQRLKKMGLTHTICHDILYAHPHQPDKGRSVQISALSELQMEIQRTDSSIERNSNMEWGRFFVIEPQSRQPTPALQTQTRAAFGPSDIESAKIQSIENIVRKGQPHEYNKAIAELRWSLELANRRLEKIAIIPSLIQNIQRVTASIEADLFRPHPSHSTRKVVGADALDQLIECYSFSSVMIVNTPSTELVSALRNEGKGVVSLDRTEAAATDIIADICTHELPTKAEVIWTSSLHREMNPGQFIQGLLRNLADDGVLVMNVPNATHLLGSGNTTLWNAGLVLYSLIRSGMDCKGAKVRTFTNVISVIVQRSGRKIPEGSVSFANLNDFFPVPIWQHFDGRIGSVNWT